MYSDWDTAKAVGCPIRKSMDQRVLTPPHGLSQRATSFIASTCQGIHQMLLSRLAEPPSCSVNRTGQTDPSPYMTETHAFLTCMSHLYIVKEHIQPKAGIHIPSRDYKRTKTMSVCLASSVAGLSAHKRRSNHPVIPSPQRDGGAGRDRTDDPLLAKQVLSQLSYSPFNRIA